MNKINVDVSKRRVPVIPPKGEKLKILLDTDAKNEIDDQYAMALAMLSPERFDIVGFVGSNFDNERGGADSVQKSVDEVNLMLDKAGFSGKWPVLHGSDPMRYQFEPSESEGVDFIIEKAMEATPGDPLWLVVLGASTDAASAYLKKPEIAERMVVFFHGRTRWPEFCYNFNVFGDVRAARTLFHAPLSLVLFDTGTYLTAPMEETEKYLKPYGELGRYLHEYRLTHPGFQSPKKGFFDMGDVAALYDPDLGCWEITDCPSVGWDLRYDFHNTKGQILRCYHIDRDRSFHLLYDKVKQYYG